MQDEGWYQREDTIGEVTYDRDTQLLYRQPSPRINVGLRRRLRSVEIKCQSQPLSLLIAKKKVKKCGN